MSTIEERTAARAAEIAAKMEAQRRTYNLHDFRYDAAQDKYWCLPTRGLLADRAVDALIPRERWRVEIEEPEWGGTGRKPKVKERLIRPSIDIRDIDNQLIVEGSAWWPGEGEIIEDWRVDRSGVKPLKGARTFNLYEAPGECTGSPAKAKLWVDHVKELWPSADEHEVFFDWAAHMIQRPWEKCNFGIVLSGRQGIGKDATLLPLKEAVGSWNANNIDPDDLFDSKSSPWLQSVLLVIDEVRPQRDDHRASAMYNMMKPLLTAPPDTLMMKDKYEKSRFVRNIVRVVMTTNDWMAMYLPEEDRRIFILDSAKPKQWASTDYFRRLFTFLYEGGSEHVRAWLMERDISKFNPKAEPPKTRAKTALSDSWGAPDDEISSRIDTLGYPDIFFANELIGDQFDDRDAIASLLKSPRRIAGRMRLSGYQTYRRPSGKRWVFDINGRVYKVRTVFLKETLGMPESETQVSALVLKRVRQLFPEFSGDEAAATQD